MMASLKCVVAWSNERHLCDLVAEALAGIAEPGELRRLGDETFVLWTTDTAAVLRDRLRSVVRAGEGLFVIDFEVWSGYGGALDAEWLLRRGH